MADKKIHTPKDSHYARLRRTHRDSQGAQPAKQQGEAPAGSRRCAWVKNVWGCRKARWIC